MAKRLTKARFVSRFAHIRLFPGRLFAFVHPFAGCHSCDCLERPEEGRLIGKSGFEAHAGRFHVGMLAEQLLGVFHAIAVDEVGKGSVFVPCRDAFRDVASRRVEHLGHVAHLQVALQV